MVRCGPQSSVDVCHSRLRLFFILGWQVIRCFNHYFWSLSGLNSMGVLCFLLQLWASALFLSGLSILQFGRPLATRYRILRYISDSAMIVAVGGYQRGRARDRGSGANIHHSNGYGSWSSCGITLGHGFACFDRGSSIVALHGPWAHTWHRSYVVVMMTVDGGREPHQE